MTLARVMTLGALGLASGVLPCRAQTVGSASTQVATQSSGSWTTVTYLSGQHVYVDAGTANGLREGSRLEVVRGGSVIATILVAFISSTKSSCTIESARVPVAVGDSVRFVLVASPRAAEATTAPFSRPASGRGRPLHGRLGMRYLSIAAPNTPGMRQPAVDARVEGPLGSLVGVTVDVRAHRTRLIDTAVPARAGETRVYQAAIQLQRERDPGRLVIGRQFAAAVSPIGLFDGVSAELDFRRWGLGVFGGTQPDPMRFAYSTLIREYGAWLQMHNAPGASGVWSVTTAAVGSYHGSDVNREFVYAQGVWVTRRASIIVSQELDFNRGWKTDAGEPSATLTSSFATVRISPIDGLSLTAGIDNRRNVRLYRDLIDPEMEFDDSFRRGVWGGANLSLGQHVQLGGDVRSSEGGPAGRASSSSVSLGLVRLTRLQVGLRGRTTAYAGESLSGSLQSVSLEFRPVSPLRLEITSGVRVDRNATAGAAPRRLGWSGVDADIALGRSWYLMVSTQRESGGGERGRHDYAALSWRF